MMYQATEHAGTKSSLNLLMSIHELRCPIDRLCVAYHIDMKVCLVQLHMLSWAKKLLQMHFK